MDLGFLGFRVRAQVAHVFCPLHSQARIIISACWRKIVWFTCSLAREKWLDDAAGARMTRHIKIKNPKQCRAPLQGRDTWYPYYAGFSTIFAHELLASSELSAGDVILDPWNGAGTTSSAAQALGFHAIGFDLNPVMVIAAKARVLCSREKNSLVPIAREILSKATTSNFVHDPCDPLLVWFDHKTVEQIRRVEECIQRLLTDFAEFKYLLSSNLIDELSDLAAFFYTGLFRTIRHYIQPYVPSNPTWTKRPKDEHDRVRLPDGVILSSFLCNIEAMADCLEIGFGQNDSKGSVNVSVANSQLLPLPDCSVDFVLSSPPYCTRIDYAVATMPELALLGFHPESSLKSLRHKMIGTSTISLSAPHPDSSWGNECNMFLEQVHNHSSKASSTYYYKTHVQYFCGMYSSLFELARTLKPDAIAVLVAQDSYYKNVHNNLPLIIADMASGLGLSLESKVDFKTSTSMANVHPSARRYRRHTNATESVLVFRRSVNPRSETLK